MRATMSLLRRSAILLVAAASLVNWSVPRSFRGDAALCDATRRAATGSEVRLDAMNSTSASMLNKVATERPHAAYGKLPLSFEANHGQGDLRAQFVARGVGFTLSLAQAEVDLTFPTDDSSALRMKLVGGNKNARVFGLDELPGKSNYFIGKDPKKWRVDVPNFSRVKYEDAYPGVDVVFYGIQDELEFDFIVAPGASFKPVRLAFDGAQGVRLDNTGDVLIQASAGEIRHRRPVVYQEENGVRQSIAAGYALSNNGEVMFEIGAYDHTKRLIIDPALSYSTYLGGSSLRRIAVDSAGNAYLAGTVSLGSSAVGSNAFVIKVSAAGTTVLYSTFLGGGDGTPTPGVSTQAFGLAVDSDGNAYVTGSTDSKTFPTTPGAFQTALPGLPGLPGPYSRTGGFVTKLSSAGNSLGYSTYLSGTDFGSSSGEAIAIDSQGNAYVTGDTNDRKFPTTEGAFQRVGQGACPVPSETCFEGCLDVFVLKLNSSGSGLMYSTFLGGRGTNQVTGIAVDASGSAYVAGFTNSANFPTTPTAFQIMRADSRAGDAFVTKLDPFGSGPVYSTLLGGGGSEGATGIAVDSSGNAYIIGWTESNDFPITPGALQPLNSDGTLFKSTDAGATWSAIHKGIRSSSDIIHQIEFDPLMTNTVYVIAGGELLKSSDGGNSWRSLSFKDACGGLGRVAIDPTNPLIMYGGEEFGPFSQYYKSTDGGVSWFRIGLGQLNGAPIDIQIDRRDPGTVYAATDLPQGSVTGVFKSTDSGMNWFPSAGGIARGSISALAMAQSKPNRLYAVSGGDVYRSANRAKKWHLGGYSGNSNAANLVVDPTNPNTVYLATSSGVYKSIDAGETFRATALASSVRQLAIDPKNTTIVYAGNAMNSPNKLFKSTDGGLSWITIGAGITGSFVSALAIDRNNTSVIYAGTFYSYSAESFATKLNSTGTALVYSTYLGGTGDDRVNAIAVDAQGNAYLTGQTFSTDFPIKSAIQARKLGGYDALLTRLDSAGGLMYSTYLGGSSDDIGWSIALDSTGGIYIAGGTASDDFPTVNPIQPTRNGTSSNGFVTKFVDR